MYLMSNDKNSIINLDSITAIYIGADGRTIKADFGNNKGCQIGIYKSQEAAQTAIEIIGGKIKVEDKIIYMPSEQEISARIAISNPIKLDRINGKKTKGHGGS